jgi:hypothetical protein
VNFFTIKNQKMSKNEIFQSESQESAETGSSSFTEGSSVIPKLISRVKRIVLVTFIAGTALFLNGCMAGYVATEPVYVEYARPQRPSELHVWIDGDWRYNSQSHGYIQRSGYWERPRQNQSYVSGHWQTNPRGKSWSKGYWQKNGHKGNNRNR